MTRSLKISDGLNAQVTPGAEANRDIIAFQIDEDDEAPIRPAPRERKWMDVAYKKFPYRCLPLVVANQYGWEILSTHHVRATWDGTSHRDGIVIENLYGDGELHCESHFGSGVVTFHMPYLFRTPDNWNLMVRGPTNNPKDGIIGLDAIVETDWSYTTFTMNWRFTRACTVEFALGEPICLIFPMPRGVLESFQGKVRMLETDPALQSRFREWCHSRDKFLAGLEKEKPEIMAQGWQKDYFHDARDKKVLARPFQLESDSASGMNDHAADNSA